MQDSLLLNFTPNHTSGGTRVRADKRLGDP